MDVNKWAAFHDSLKTSNRYIVNKTERELILHPKRIDLTSYLTRNLSIEDQEKKNVVPTIVE